MKAIIEIITIFLLVNAVVPAPMYYIYDDTPDTGYGATIGSAGPYKNHKKYFIGSNNQKYMKLVNERAIDSHFSVQKSPSRPYVINGEGKFIVIAEIPRENYRRKQNNSEHHSSVSTKHELDKTNQNKNKTTMSDNPLYNINQNLHLNRQFDYLRNSHDKKHNYVSVNARKAALPKDDKVVVKKNNQQIIQQPQGYQIKIAGVGTIDKALHKPSITNKRTMQMAVTKNEDLEHRPQMALENAYDIKKSASNSQRMDSKKRDTANKQPSTPEQAIISGSVSDQMKKYIHKEANNYKENKNTGNPSRIDKYEETVDSNETPYALFYRTNSEHLDGQDVLIENPLAAPKTSAFNDKMTWYADSEVQEHPMRNKSKRTPNVKIHKKVKNHTSFRNR